MACLHLLYNDANSRPPTAHHATVKNDSTYFENRDCEYYPCHAEEHINCLFCYCPLYFLKCPGDYTWVAGAADHQVKDCSNCTVTHDPVQGWKIVQQGLSNPALDE